MRRHVGSAGIGPNRITTMQRFFAAFARVGVLLVAGGTAWGCRQTSDTVSSGRRARRLVASNPDTGSKLRALLLGDTIAAGD